MQNLAARRKAQSEAKRELSEDDKFIGKLQTDVCDYLNIWRASSLGQQKSLDRCLDEKQPVDAYDVDSGQTPLILAAHHGHVKLVQTLCIRGKANVHLAGYQGATALHHACKSDNYDVVKYLVEEMKANTEAEDDAGNTALHVCGRVGDLRCFEYLASRGANLDHQNRRGITPFLVAVLHGHSAIIDFLLKRAIQINATDSSGNTALHYAVRCGYSHIAKSLLSAHIKTNAVNGEGFRADQLAQDPEITHMLQTHAGGGAAAAAS